MASDETPVWFITGCSTGFGRELARLILGRGWRAVLTARDAARVRDLVAGPEERGLALALDVTRPDEIAAGVEAAEARFGRIDVLVNNAGYGYQASVEEGEDAAIRAMFEANVFGLFAMSRAVLPGMRARRRGHIINISSVAGFIGLQGSGYYAASKHAVEGFSDALAKEIEPLGLRVTCIEPGPFRTDFAGRSLHQTPPRIDDYAPTVGVRLATMKKTSGTQAGDPVRAAEAIIRIAELSQPPHHLVLGAAGLAAVKDKLSRTLQEVEAWTDTSLGADYPKGERD